MIGTARAGFDVDRDVQPVRRVFLVAASTYVGYNALISLIGLIAKLPDLPSTHATTDHITVAQVLLTSGTIMSPPFVFMVLFGLLIWGATSRRTWLSGISGLLTMVLVAISAIDEGTGDGGLRMKPALYSAAKWALARTEGWIFIVISAGVLLSGLAWLTQSLRRQRLVVRAS